MMTNNPPTIITCKEGSPFRPCNDDLEVVNTKGNEVTNNGYFGRQYQKALLPDVRITSPDERPSKSKFRVRDVSPIQVPRHKTSSTCYRILVPETNTEKLVLFVCLTVFFTLLVSLVYFFVKIECTFGTKDQKCKSKYTCYNKCNDFIIKYKIFNIKTNKLSNFTGEKYIHNHNQINFLIIF